MTDVELLQKIFDTLQDLKALITDLHTYVVFFVVMVFAILLVYFILQPLWVFVRRL